MKRDLVLITNIIFIFIISINGLKAQSVEILQNRQPVSIRGLSVVDNKVAWASGNKGYVAITNNGGKTWSWQQVKGFEKADFRDIEAFSDKEAIIISSGTPALVLKTIDGGINWNLKYRNNDTTYFLDAMDFVDKQQGFVLGDPIKSKFLLLETKDGGNTWNNYINSPTALPGEAAFAASGTCLRIASNGKPYIVTGGTFAAVNTLKANNEWNQIQVPVLKGQAALGAFSIAIYKQHQVIVGGDYQHDKRSDSTACYSLNGGLVWQLAKNPPSGYQSCVEYISGLIFLSTGTTGTNITLDGGRTWSKIDDTSFNVCCKAKRGTLVLLAGDSGKIGILKM